MSYHVMSSSRGAGLGGLHGAPGLGVTSLYNEDALTPSSSSTVSDLVSSWGYDSGLDTPAPAGSDDKKKKMIIAGAAVAGVLVLGGIAIAASK